MGLMPRPPFPHPHAMNIIHLACITLALSALAPLTTTAAPRGAASQQTPDPAARFNQWKQFLSSELLPKGAGSGQDSAFRDKLNQAIAAATKARKAQMDYGYSAFNLLKSDYNSKRYNAWRESMLQEYTGLVNALFDLDMFCVAHALNSNWGQHPMARLVSDYPDLVPLQPGEHDFAEEPAISNSLAGRPAHGSICIVDNQRMGIELWQKHLADAHARLRLAYSDSDEPEWEIHGDLLSRASSSAKDNARLGHLFNEVEKTWQAYKSAMDELANSYVEEYGGGSMGDVSRCYHLERCLLDSHSRYLSAVARTFDSEDAGSRSPGCHRLHSPSGYASFGRLHNTSGLLFRHPRLAGSPWCLAPGNIGNCRSFVLLEDSPGLQQFAKKHPKGGFFELKGYYSVHAGGSPLPPLQFVDAEQRDNDFDEIDGFRIRYPQSGSDAYQIHPVFHLEAFSAEGFND